MPAWLTENAKGIAIAAVAVVALIAFIVGAVKGFTRLGWGALIWAGSCALFYALETKCHDANPLLKIGAVAKLDPGVQSFVSTLSIALLSILAALAVFGVVALVFRPKKRRKAAIKLSTRTKTRISRTLRKKRSAEARKEESARSTVS